MGIRGTRRTQELKGTVEKTERTLIEIEVALAEHFRYLSNIVLFRAINVGKTLPFYHETDCLVCSKAGYLKEIEIKRSWSDFLADFRKDHRHESEGCVSQFYYCVPISVFDKVKEKLQIENMEYSGIITYDENLNMRVEVEARKLGAKKLSIDQRLHLARLGTIRAISLMNKIVKLQTKQTKRNESEN